MGSRRCRLVAVRDQLTAQGLRRHKVAALAPGNPMMDGFRHTPLPAGLTSQRRLILLAGSRLPEALGNARRLLGCLNLQQPRQPASVLVASGSAPTAAAWAELLGQAGFTPLPPAAASAASGAISSWQRGRWTLLLSQNRFATWAGWAELGLATAGTATEQLAGLGVPCLSLPGPGPQFKAGFARRQSRLLGGAVVPCHSQQELALKLHQLLDDPAECARRGAMGRERMGPDGGSAQLAELVEQQLLG
jgi:uncharacterized protein (TIGR03492 family)